MKTRVVILAGGEGSRLGVLTAKRSKPSVPFAGKYRVIDFALSNSVNSGLFDVYLLTQYRPHSLIQHIGAGNPWDLDRAFTGGLRFLSPFKARFDSDWYSGTADAVQQNFSFVKQGNPDFVLILSGDHIYQMNYDPLIAFHADHQADVTIATLRVKLEEASRFGILATTDDYRVIDFVEKPKEPPGTLASMGIYLFSLNVLDRYLREDARRRDSNHDFGKDIIQRMVKDGMRVFAYPFSGYWVDVGTIDSYWLAHMDLLKHPPDLDLNDRSWIIHTRSEERPPVLIQKGAIVRDSLITDGSIIAPGARVERSVLSPGVYVGPNAVVRDSIIFTDSYIEAGARVERTIIDKLVSIGHNCRIGQIIPKADDLGITTIGKNAQIPNGVKIGRGAAIGTDVGPDLFVRKVVGKGKLVEQKPFTP
ncbi:MAG TPA: sugar phosphate nucleotidyltransferase [Anaerolineales bacterium]|nr:sugar phosphate nucleotidyltransferase [Anaerolineales bacterium]